MGVQYELFRLSMGRRPCDAGPDTNGKEEIMARKSTEKTPTDEEIMSYDNVPYQIAAKYIGWSSCNVAYALQQERAPYGHAAQTGTKPDGTPTYTYNISPGLLVGYKHGTIQAWHLGELIKLFESRVSGLIDGRLEAAAEVVRGTKSVI